MEDDCPATFSEYIFLHPACLMIFHWLTENVELNFLKDNFSILIGLENAVHLGWVGYAIPGTLA